MNELTPTQKLAMITIGMNSPLLRFLDKDAVYSNGKIVAERLQYITTTLINIYDEKRPLPRRLLRELQGLDKVAGYVNEAEIFNVANPDDSQKRIYQQKIKQAQQELLACFGLAKRDSNRPKKSDMIIAMAHELALGINEETCEMEDGFQPVSIRDAAKKVARQLEYKAFKSPENAWKKYEEEYYSELSTVS